jgi:hypothetical protein
MPVLRLLCLVQGFIRDDGDEDAVEVAGDVALEAADGLALGPMGLSVDIAVSRHACGGDSATAPGDGGQDCDGTRGSSAHPATSWSRPTDTSLRAAVGLADGSKDGSKAGTPHPGEPRGG